MSVAGGAKNTLGFGFNIVLAIEEFYLHGNGHHFDQQWPTWALSGSGDDTQALYRSSCQNFYHSKKKKKKKQSHHFLKVAFWEHENPNIMII
jgi:hypothetical protein